MATTKSEAPRCARCGRPLKNATSVALGLGPVCRTKVAGGRVAGRDLSPEEVAALREKWEAAHRGPQPPQVIGEESEELEGGVEAEQMAAELKSVRGDFDEAHAS